MTERPAGTALGCIGEGLAELAAERDSGGLTLGFGGDVANTAVMAAIMGADVRLGARVGDDALGRRLLEFWAARGVDVAHVVVDGEAPTGIYVNEIDPATGEHRFDYHRRGSAGSRLGAEDLDDAFVSGLGVLHLSGITLAVSPASRAAGLDAVERARRHGARISFAVNHRPVLGGDVAELATLANGADTVFLSREEASVVGVPGGAEVVVTEGEAGAVLYTSDGCHEVTAPRVNALDAAGAGDALAGAYLATRLAGGDPEQALRRGVAAASLSCRSRGCALSYPDPAEVDALS